MEKVPYLDTEIRRWQVGPSTFLARPEAGARLMAWHITHADGTDRDIIHWPELTTTEEFHRVRGGNPILFPFSARTFENGELGFWRHPVTGERLPMAMHGYARQGRFTLSQVDARGFEATFVPDAEAQAAYPFNYEFKVSYRFAPLALVCEFSLTNLGEERLPWSAGHHFYFNVPWLPGAQRADYEIELPATQRWRQTATGQLIAGPTLPTTVSLADPALIDTIHTGLSSPLVRFGPADGTAGIVSLQHGVGDRPAPDATFVTWTLDDDAPFYCVEPWMGPPNAPEHQRGLHWVEPGQTGRFSVRVSVD